MATPATYLPPTRPPAATGPSLFERYIQPRQAPVLFLVANALVGAASLFSPLVATAHAVVVLVAALAFALLAPRIEFCVYAVSYVATCDVFWRMSKARVPWEGPKYVIIVVFALALLRFVPKPKRTLAPVLYLVCLLPAVIVTVLDRGLSDSRALVSGVIIGPIALGFSVLFFRQIVATAGEAERILWLAIGPVVATSAFATRNTILAGNISFTGESNYVTAGGFGPNQVSSMLGFGALLCVLLALHKGNKRALVIKLGLAAWFAGQAALTLSRGGIYGFIFGCLAVALVGLFTKGFRSRVLTVAVMAGIIGFLVFGWLNVFTGGALQNRFDSTDSTNRTGVIDSDLELWQSNLAFGTGVGLSQYERDASAATLDISTHTEYTRLLAEHGLLGLAALGCMVSMCVSAIRNSMSRWNRLIAAGLVALSAIQMAHSATRIATIAFAIGLANLRVEE